LTHRVGMHWNMWQLFRSCVWMNLHPIIVRLIILLYFEMWFCYHMMGPFHLSDNCVHLRCFQWRSCRR
jgi:hypothetical protein